MNKAVTETLEKLGPYNPPQRETDLQKGIELEPYKFTNGVIYHGEWLSGKRHGLGK